MAHRELTFLRQIKSINVGESKQWEKLHNVSAKRVILIISLLCFIQKISKIGGKSTTTPPLPNQKKGRKFTSMGVQPFKKKYLMIFLSLRVKIF